MVSRVSEGTITIVLGFILTFLLINFNVQLGQIFGFIALFDFITIIIITKFQNRNLRLPSEHDDRRINDLIVGTIGYGLFVVISTIAVPLLTVTKEPFQSVFSTLASSTPVLAGSDILTLIGWGIIIPIVETRFFFGRMYEFFLNSFNASDMTYNRKNVLIILLVSFIFTLFHLQSRSVATAASGGTVVFDTVALVLTFIFGVVSLILVNQTRELASAIYLHIITNTIATMQNIGTLGVAGASG